MAQAAGIFVSHAHEDNAWCRAFVQALRDAGADVWYDEHNLGYGRIGNEIERELKARSIFVVILSPASVGKPWVRREMEAAISLQDRDSTRIILPVVAEKAEIPLFWESYKRVGGPGDAGLTAAEAAGRVVHTLGIVPAEAPAATPPPVATETAAEANERGNGLYAQKRYEEALAAYERALELNPQLAEAWSNKGLSLYNLERYEEALVAIERALALDPQYAIAWNGKGAVLRYLERYEEALVAIERALALDPQLANAWYHRGATLAELKRYEEALAAYERALALDPQSTRFWRDKIALLRQLGHTAEAEEAERQRDASLQRRG